MIRAMLYLWLVCGMVMGTQASAGTPGEISVGETLPDTLMQGLNRPPKRLAEFRGKPLIINVWASWCGPCRSEMASLERLAWRNNTSDATGFRIIGISTDDYPARAKTLLHSTNATISHFIDSKLRLEHMLGASRIPLTVLVSAEGRVLTRIYGARDWDSPAARELIHRIFSSSEQASSTPARDHSPGINQIGEDQARS